MALAVVTIFAIAAALVAVVALAHVHALRDTVVRLEETIIRNRTYEIENRTQVYDSIARCMSIDVFKTCTKPTIDSLIKHTQKLEQEIVELRNDIAFDRLEKKTRSGK